MALEVREALAEKSPDSIAAQRDLSVSYNKLADIKKVNGVQKKKLNLSFLLTFDDIWCKIIKEKVFSPFPKHTNFFKKEKKMDTLKKIFPYSFKEKQTVGALIVNIIIQVLVEQLLVF